MDKSPAVFEGSKIRRHYNEKTETGRFSLCRGGTLLKRLNVREFDRFKVRE